MEVWVVEHGRPADYSYVSAVFSTRELAEEWVHSREVTPEAEGEHYNIWLFFVDEKANK
jgi:hypothetical protein